LDKNYRNRAEYLEVISLIAILYEMLVIISKNPIVSALMTIIY